MPRHKGIQDRVHFLIADLLVSRPAGRRQVAASLSLPHTTNTASPLGWPRSSFSNLTSWFLIIFAIPFSRRLNRFSNSVASIDRMHASTSLPSSAASDRQRRPPPRVRRTPSPRPPVFQFSADRTRHDDRGGLALYDPGKSAGDLLGLENRLLKKSVLGDGESDS